MGASPPPITAAPVAGSAVAPPLKFRLFVDFWNLQITLNERHSQQCERDGVPHTKIQIDWTKLPACLIDEAAKMVGVVGYTYEGTIVFTSFNPKKPQDKKYHNWAKSWLDRQPGIQVRCFERRPSGPPKCPACHREIATCSHEDCGQPLSGTVEKGVDTAIATDMIRLAWEKAYDVAVLATSDADLVPAVEFLDLKGIRAFESFRQGSRRMAAIWRGPAGGTSTCTNVARVMN